MIRVRSLIKGMGSFVLSRSRNPHGRNTLLRPEDSYALFSRYLIALGRHARFSFEGKTVLEFGPGSSFGLGIAALLSGAECYYAVDLIDHTGSERNLAVFDALVAMFRGRASVPAQGWSEHIFPFLDDDRFPSDLLPEALLERTLAPERLQMLRHDLETAGGVHFRALFASDIALADLGAAVDLIFSESVLEHVDELDTAYRAFARWLSPNGVMVHLLDYSAHGLTSEWNGHWSLSRRLWFLLRGKRFYLINRAPHSVHLELLQANGFQIIRSELLRRVDGLDRGRFAHEYRSMSLADATTHVAAMMCRLAKTVTPTQADVDIKGPTSVGLS